jgi:hypothetical protein
VEECRARWLTFHSTYNPGNVKSKDMISFIALDSGLRRTLGGITVELSACSVASGLTDSEELEFVGAVALEGRKVSDENLAFMQTAGRASAGMLVEVNKVAQRLEAHHEELQAMLEKVEDIGRARQSGFKPSSED